MNNPFKSCIPTPWTGVWAGVLVLTSSAQCWEGADEDSVSVLGGELLGAEELQKEKVLEYP